MKLTDGDREVEPATHGVTAGWRSCTLWRAPVRALATPVTACGLDCRPTNADEIAGRLCVGTSGDHSAQHGLPSNNLYDRWPGAQPPLDFEHKVSLSITHNDVLDLTRDLAKYLEEFVSGKDEAHQHIKQTVNISSDEVGGWEGGQDFYNTMTQANTSITNAHSTFIETCKAVVERLLKSTTAYADAEESAKQSVLDILKDI
jgi:hypothetical protein